MNTIRALIIIHPGFEEMEAVAPIDLLFRADIEVTTASLDGDRLVRGRSGIEIAAQLCLHDLPGDEIFDVVILPGGPGINKLRGSPTLCELLRKHHRAGKIVACICAAPLLLLDAGILPEKYTAYPATSSELPDAREQDCVLDKGILTSRGAGTATQFGLALVEALTDEATRIEIANSICWSDHSRL